MFGKLMNTLKLIDSHPILRQRVHYLPDYDEELGLGLSLGANSSINTPIVGLEACGTSWMKDVANMGLLISTHDGGVADMPSDNYLTVSGKTEAEECELICCGRFNERRCIQHFSGVFHVRPGILIERLQQQGKLNRRTLLNDFKIAV